MIGITIKDHIGIGDKVQFSSLPENYYRSTGEKLIDVSRSWIFDHNPYVVRGESPHKTIELWNFPKQYDWPKPGSGFYRSNAEIWANLLGVKAVLNRPRLYKFEEPVPFEKRDIILFHTHGRSHGVLPDKVIRHVLDKYKGTGKLFHIGPEGDPYIGIPKIIARDYWELASVISKSRMFIGVDSGPSWIAACYPDVQIKKIRNLEVHGEKPMEEWMPLEASNIHSYWDDRAFQIYYTSEDDCGFMQSYKKL